MTCVLLGGSTDSSGTSRMDGRVDSRLSSLTG